MFPLVKLVDFEIYCIRIMGLKLTNLHLKKFLIEIVSKKWIIGFFFFTVSFRYNLQPYNSLT